MATAMRVRFWGVRGSVPTPQREHLGFGGNTSCVEVRTSDDQILILDGGTGIRLLGDALLRESGDRALHLHILFSHFHLDHIQGIPFFGPLHDSRHHCTFYGAGPALSEVDRPSPSNIARTALAGILSPPYSPIDLSELPCHCTYVDLEAGRRVAIGETTILNLPLNHPQGCAGYRITQHGKAIAYCTDVEHGPAWSDRNIRLLAKDADLLIIDAQYTPEELPGHIGWGHSSWLQAINAGVEAGARRVALYHHDPDHDDRKIDSILAHARQRHPDVIAAREGLEVSL